MLVLATLYASSLATTRLFHADILTCGDGTVDMDEECDDGDTTPGDGCSATCEVEANWTCDSSDPSACHQIVFTMSGSEFDITTPDAQPLDIAAGSGGVVWFTASGASMIGKIINDGTITEFPTTTSDSGPYGIAASGSGGMMWFTERYAGQIGVIAPDGTITEYPLLDTASAPLGIAKGPDGNMWFAESATNKIGRITSTGAIVEYDLTGSPQWITAGPDGKMWFTEPNDDTIGSIAMDGTVAEFPIGSSTMPTAIAQAFDGRLWFTQRTTPFHVSTITVGGVLAESQVVVEESNGIIRGSGSVMWLTSSGSNAIGKMTGTGEIISYTIPTPVSHPLRLTMDGSGTIWFTEYAANIIGRLVPSEQQDVVEIPSSSSSSSVSSGTGSSVSSSSASSVSSGTGSSVSSGSGSSTSSSVSSASSAVVEESGGGGGGGGHRGGGGGGGRASALSVPVEYRFTSSSSSRTFSSARSAKAVVFAASSQAPVVAVPTPNTPTTTGFTPTTNTDEKPFMPSSTLSSSKMSATTSFAELPNMSSSAPSSERIFIPRPSPVVPMRPAAPSSKNPVLEIHVESVASMSAQSKSSVVRSPLAAEQPMAPLAAQTEWRNAVVLNAYAPQHPPVGQTGPASLAVVSAGAGAGIAWMRRKKKV